MLSANGASLLPIDSHNRAQAFGHEGERRRQIREFAHQLVERVSPGLFSLGTGS